MKRNRNRNPVAAEPGSAMGRVDQATYEIATAGMAAENNFEEISRHVQALKRQLQANAEGLHAPALPALPRTQERNEIRPDESRTRAD